jgi:hypothetical protein
MRVSEIFARGGGDWGNNGYRGDTGGLQTFLPYGTVEKPGGYYPDTGRWAYANPNSYNYAGDGSGYGFSRSHGLDGFVG